MYFFGQLKVLATGHWLGLEWCPWQFGLCKLVCGKVLSVLRGSTPTLTTHSTVVRGTETRRNYLVACLVLLFTALGFPLSFRKGSRGTSVDWIGLNLSVRPRVVALDNHCGSGPKWLKSFAGKASSFASILIFWRPFLRSIWTAIYAVPSDGTPRNCVWGEAICGRGQMDSCILEWCSREYGQSFCS